MAQTQLNRVYVQTIDSTGTTDPTLSLGVKSLTTTVKIGGIGTGGNSINVSSTGINMSGPLNALGQTNLQNTSILNVGVTGQTTLQNTSINGTLNAAGLATLINVSTTSLSVLNNVSVGGNVSVTGNLYVSSTMILPTLTVGSNAVLANASVNGTLKVDGLTTLANASINGTLNADGLTTLRGLRVNGGTDFYNSVGIANNSLSITGTGGFNVAGQTTLQNTSVQGLTAAGKTWLSNTSITGPTDINVTGTATTTIGGTSGMTVVAGNASLRNVSAQALTVGPLWAGATTVGSLVATGNTSVQNVSAQALTVGPMWAGATTLASSSVTGNSTVTGTLGVTALTTLSGGATVTGTTNINSTGSGTTIIGSSSSATTALNSVATTVGGTLGVTGVTTLGTLVATGNTSVQNVSCSSLTAMGNVGIGTEPTLGLDIRRSRACIGIRKNTGNTTGDVAVLGFNSGASGGENEGDDFPDTNSQYGTLFGARIKAVALAPYGSQSDLYFQYKSNAFYGNVTFDGGYSTAMIIKVGGNVGIGTTSPTYTLDVSGQTRLGTPNNMGGLQVQGTTASNAPTAHDFVLGQRQHGRSLIIRTEPDLNVASNAASDTASTTKTYFFHWGSTKSVIMTHNGFVGFGVTPGYPLHVTNASGAVSSTYRKFDKDTGAISASTTAAIAAVGIYSASSILTGDSFIANSDRRIKTNIVDVEDDRALQDLRRLKPKTYTYKDIIHRGTEPVYGFIAQEVKDVLNYTVSTHTDAIPNIYELATFTADTLTLDFNTSELSRDASGALFTKLKIKSREDKDEFVNILEVIDEHTLRLDKDLTEWGGALDASGQVVPGDKIFVYGQEVNDFHNLNKDAIWTVATAALQEVDRQLQAEKQKTSALQSAFDALLERVVALEQKSAV